MPWPLASHFQAMLQNPRVAFRDPELRSLSFEKDSLGQPRAWSGAFAVVYKGIDPAGNPRAVRVFSSESPQRRGRYDCIAGYLRGQKADCLIDFEYRSEEIRSPNDGNRYPLVLMDWVEGQTLFQWLRNQCCAGGGALLQEAADNWLALVGELTEAQIAHGDFQHANIMVTSLGQLKLVDYDGMCVPSLVGHRNLEVGTPPYQHPQRNADTLLSLGLDNFSALLVYVVLRALAAQPQLWTKHVEQPGYDKLLFREDDFRYPDKSALRKDLRESPDPQVAELAEYLFASAAGSLDRVPQLGEMVTEQPRAESDNSTDRLPTAVDIRAQERAVECADEAFIERTVRGPETPSSGLATPKVAGYEIGQRLGTGMLGIVHKAVAVLTRQSVAVKFIPVKASISEYARHRLLREIERAGQLQHRNILRVLKSGVAGNTIYLVMEYCDGGNLAQWMRQNGGRLSIPLARVIMLQCLDGLKHAHLHRVIHGDLNPGNILLDTSPPIPVARLTDFSLSKYFEMAEAFSTGAKMRRVRDHFVPRERLTNTGESRPVSDLWSLAAVFYYALSGKFPWDFGNREPAEVILSEDCVPLHRRDGSIPAPLADVLDRALRTNPAHRYQTAAELKAALEGAFLAIDSSSKK